MMWPLEPWAPSSNCQNFKVLHFRYYFRGVSIKSILEIIWDQLHQKPFKIVLFTIFCVFQPLPRFEDMPEPSLPNPPKSSLIFRVLYLVSPKIYGIYNQVNFKPRNLFYCLKTKLLIASSLHPRRENKVFRKTTCYNLVFWRWIVLYDVGYTKTLLPIYFVPSTSTYYLGSRLETLYSTLQLAVLRAKCPHY